MANDNREIRVFKGLELRSNDDGGKVLSGYAAVYRKLSNLLYGSFREKFEPGAFADSVRGDEEDQVALFNHRADFVLGRLSAGTLRLSEKQKGLRMEIDLPDTSVGRDIVVSVERGDINGASISFQAIDDNWATKDEVDIRTVSKARLFDVSPVTFPAYPDTSVAVRSYDAWKNESAEAVASRMRQRERELEVLELEAH